jgi:hypothetical protein
VVFYVETAALDPVLKGRPSAIFGIVIDDSDQVLWVEGKLIAEGSFTSIGVGGGAADQIARNIALATRSVAASILAMPPRTDVPQYNRAQFPIAGAADAIKTAYAGCGRGF